MNEYHVYHLPVVHRDDYMALISEDDILDWATPEKNLAHAEFLTFRPAVFVNNHPIEAIKIVKEFGLSVIPVMDLGRNFLGCITYEGLFKYLTDTNTFSEEGGIIVLSIPPIQYSLAEITRLAESNDVVVHGVLVRSDATSGRFIVTLKTNKTDLRSLIATLERYEYYVVDVYSDVKSKENLTDNYNLLRKYLEM